MSKIFPPEIVKYIQTHHPRYPIETLRSQILHIFGVDVSIHYIKKNFDAWGLKKRTPEEQQLMRLTTMKLFPKAPKTGRRPPSQRRMSIYDAVITYREPLT